MSILAGLFLYSSSIEELDRRLNEYIANQDRIKKFIDALAQGTNVCSLGQLEERYLYNLERKLDTMQNLRTPDEHQQ